MIVLLGLAPGILDSDRLALIQTVAPNLDIVVTTDRSRMATLLDQVEVAAGSVPLDLIAQAPNLKWFQQWGAGSDWLMSFPEIRANSFILTNTSGLHAAPVSEHVLALLLGFARGIPRALRSQAAKEWDRVPGEALFELTGKTALIVGLGAIGLRTAQQTSALGMEVLGVRKSPAGNKDLPFEVHQVEELPQLLPKADFIILTLPLTSESHGLIGAREFEAMKRSAYLINVGRGKLVKEADLIEALKNGLIAGAGLDVFEDEPLPVTSPLWEMPNVMITAHYAGATPHYNDSALKIFIDNLRLYVEGSQLFNVVSRREGY